MLMELDRLALAFENRENLAEFLNQEQVSEVELQDTYGLTLSDIYHAWRCEYIHGLRNLDVLEIGGRLSRPFLKRCIKPNSWTSVGTYYDGEPHSRIGIESPSLILKPEWNQFCNYSVLTFVEYVKDLMDTKEYDRIYSIAAFEHIHKLGDCIESLSKLLKKGGILYSYFTSCWCGVQGHHWSKMPKILGEYDHLVLTEGEMLEGLVTSGMSKSEAIRNVYYMYRGARINRNTHTDYLEAFSRGTYTERKISCINAAPANQLLSHERYKRFKDLYPREEILCDGYEVVLIK